MSELEEYYYSHCVICKRSRPDSDEEEEWEVDEDGGPLCPQCYQKEYPSHD